MNEHIAAASWMSPQEQLDAVASNPAPAQSSAPARKLELLQVLRALAAGMVVFGHISGNARNHPELFGVIPKLHFVGGAGVDLFFLISGFIMVHASSRLFGAKAGPREFLRRRLIRIVPLYWLATLISLAILTVRGSESLSPAAIMASFAFIPFNTLNRADGIAFPILDLGWTLNYEMMFYVIFALFLPLRKVWCVLAVAATLGCVVLAGWLWPTDNAALYFWSRPITLEFVAGMFISLAIGRWHPNWSIWVRLALVVVSVALFLYDPMNLFAMAITPNDTTRLIGWGIPAFLMMLAGTMGPSYTNNQLMRAFVEIGDSSFALYLLHHFVIIAMLHTAIKGMNMSSIYGWAVIFISFTASILTAIAAHRLIEAPVTQHLLTMTRPQSRRQIQD